VVATGEIERKLPERRGGGSRMKALINDRTTWWTRHCPRRATLTRRGRGIAPRGMCHWLARPSGKETVQFIDNTTGTCMDRPAPTR
jgi:hypothetical protein